MDQKISQLNSATSINGNELIPIVQSGQTKKIKLNEIPMGFACLTYTVNQVIAGINIDDYPLGTFVKIISGSTTLPFGIDYILSHVIYDDAQSKNVLSRNVEFVLTNGKHSKGRYTATTNYTELEFNMLGLITQVGTNAPSWFWTVDEFNSNWSSNRSAKGIYQLIPSIDLRNYIVMCFPKSVVFTTDVHFFTAKFDPTYGTTGAIILETFKDSGQREDAILNSTELQIKIILNND